MAVKAWFNYNTYMANKLIQIQAAEPNAGWTAASLKAAFEKAGFAGDTGAQAHFLKYGHSEDVSPNSLFNATYYYQAKAIQYYTSDKAGSEKVDEATVKGDLAAYGAKMEAIIKGVGMDAWTHYTKYGTKEGINPSNDFDTSSYMEAKIAAMGGTMTADQVYAAFKKAGFNALMHEQIYAGKGGANEVTATSFPVPEDEQFTPEGDGDGGDTFTLTTGNDYADTTTSYREDGRITTDFKFTSNDETVTSEAGTLNDGDVLVDGTTTDNDVMNATVTGAALVAPTIEKIETINLKVTTAARGLDLNNVADAKNINVTASFGAGAGQAAVLTHVDAKNAPVIGFTASGNRGLNVEVDTLAGTGDNGETLSFELLGTSAANNAVPTITINNNSGTSGILENVEIKSSGEDANAISLVTGTDVASIGKYVISGDQSIELRGTAAALSGATVDGSEHTGETVAFRVDMDGANNAVTRLDVARYSDVDQLTIWDSNTVNTPGQTVVTANGFNLVGVADSSTVRVGSNFNGTTASTISMASTSGSSDTLTLDFNNVSSNGGVTGVATGLTVAGVENLNIMSNNAAGGQNVITLLTDTNLTNLAVEGSSNLSVTLGAIAATNGQNVTVDASAFTSQFTFDGHAILDTTAGGRTVTMIGGSGNDNLRGGDTATIANVFDLSNGGNDTVFVAKQAAPNTDINDVIKGLSNGDTITMSGASADATHALYNVGVIDATAYTTIGAAAAQAYTIGGNAAGTGTAFMWQNTAYILLADVAETAGDTITGGNSLITLQGVDITADTLSGVTVIFDA